MHYRKGLARVFVRGWSGGLVWPVYCELAGDEDVEEGEGQNENSGESDEAPPKVIIKCVIHSCFVNIVQWMVACICKHLSNLLFAVVKLMSLFQCYQEDEDYSPEDGRKKKKGKKRKARGEEKKGRKKKKKRKNESEEVSLNM